MATRRDEDVDLASLKKLMLVAKYDGNKSMLATALETFRMADPKTKRGDIFVQEHQQGVELLSFYSTQMGEILCWDVVPLEPFQATREDLFMAFLCWAEKEKDGQVRINVSKAQRRMDAYFQWMQDHHDDLEDPLTVESIQDCANLWELQGSHDEQGRFVWWIDLGSVDKQAVREIDNKHHLRYVVWFSHLVMFDVQARKNGVIAIEDMGHLGFWNLASQVPGDLRAKMDRLTIGILPVKMKAIYVFGAASGLRFLMKLLYPFMRKKMRERVVLLPDETNMQNFCDKLVCRQNIPNGFCGMQGEAPRDAFLQPIESPTETL